MIADTSVFMFVVLGAVHITGGVFPIFYNIA